LKFLTFHNHQLPNTRITYFYTFSHPKIWGFDILEIWYDPEQLIITLASFKGGVGKTTTSVHLAAYLQARGPTVLVDGDANRSAATWAKHGQLPFAVVDERRLAKAAREYEHVVIDTAARPSVEELQDLVAGCDLLVIPSTPDALALAALMQTVETLEDLGSDRWKVLLTIVPPAPSRDGEEARALLKKAKLPHFSRATRRLSAFQKAALSGVLVHQVPDPRAALGWEDYTAVGKEVIR
jgi:chromosome partitioning protein